MVWIFTKPFTVTVMLIPSLPLFSMENAKRRRKWDKGRRRSHFPPEQNGVSGSWARDREKEEKKTMSTQCINAVSLNFTVQWRDRQHPLLFTEIYLREQLPYSLNCCFAPWSNVICKRGQYEKPWDNTPMEDWSNATPTSIFPSAFPTLTRPTAAINLKETTY